MTLEQAVDILHETMDKDKFRVNGYWKDGEDYILNTNPQYDEECLVPAQYIIKPDGQVIPTNPVRSRLTLETMKLIPKK